MNEELEFSPRYLLAPDDTPRLVSQTAIFWRAFYFLTEKCGLSEELIVGELDSVHGEYRPTEVGYAYKIGRGKKQTIMSVLTPGNYEKQLLFETTTLKFWP